VKEHFRAYDIHFLYINLHIFYFFKDFIHSFETQSLRHRDTEREREHEQGERQRQREREKHTPR